MAQFLDFKKDYIGLTPEQYEDNLEIFGQNTSAAHYSPAVKSRIVAQFKTPAFIFMLVGAVALFFLGSYIHAIILTALAVASAAAMLFLDLYTDNTANQFRAQNSKTAHVIRNGVLYVVPVEQIVPNDLLLLQEGELVPADGIIEESIDFYVDENLLIEDAGINAKSTGEPICAQYIVTKGRCILKVTATGTRTCAFKGGKITPENPIRPNLLEKQAMHAVVLCSILALVLLIPAFAVANYHSSSIAFSVLSATSLALAFVPISITILPTALLVSGSKYLSKTKRALKKLSTTKSLASVSVICADCSVGFAQSNMEVIASDSMNNELLLNIACLSCVSGSNDPADKAILAFCRSKGANIEMLQSHLLIHEYHFETENRLMGKVWDISNSKLLCVKGLPESVLPLCELSADTRYSVRAKQSELERQGLRVFAVCCQTVDDDIPESIADCKLTYVGLLGVRDELSPTVIASVASCKRAGIRVVMLTSDNPDTAVVMGASIGIELSGGIVTGKMLDNCEESDLPQLCANANIFAQLSQVQRLDVLRALKKADETVLISATGYEDITLLSHADVGVAADNSLPAVRDMANVVLPDNRFITIARAVSEARHVCDTVISSIGNTIALHLPLVLIALVLPMIGYTLPLFPSSIILLEACLAAACLLMPVIAFDKGSMSKPALYMRTSLQKMFIIKPIIQAVVIAIAAVSSYIFIEYSESLNGQGIAQSFILVLLIIAIVSLVIVNSSAASIFSRTTLQSNALFILAGTLCIVTAICYLPGMTSVFGTVPLSPVMLITAVLIGISTAIYWEVIKLCKNKLQGRLKRFFSVLFHGKHR